MTVPVIPPSSQSYQGVYPRSQPWPRQANSAWSIWHSPKSSCAVIHREVGAFEIGVKPPCSEKEYTTFHGAASCEAPSFSCRTFKHHSVPSKYKTLRAYWHSKATSSRIIVGKGLVWAVAQDYSMGLLIEGSAHQCQWSIGTATRFSYRPVLRGGRMGS